MGKIKGQITETLVEKLTPPAQGNEITWDGLIPGYGVRVTTAGRIAFVLSYRNQYGKKRLFTIGKYPKKNATSARKEARDWLERIPQEDPLEKKYQPDTEPTFAMLTERYLEKVQAKKRAGSLRNDRGHIRRLLPLWGTLQVKAITQRDVEKLHSDSKATPYHANRMLSLLSSMFNLAVEWDWCSRNPVKGIKRYDEDRREGWLTIEELQRLLKALDAYCDQSPANVIRLLLLTGAREGEALKADWSQFNMKRGVWTKPSHHTKNRKIEHVPLSKAAIALLRKMKPKESGPLFPGAGADGSSRVTLRRPWKQVCKAAGLGTAVEVKGKRRMIMRYKPKYHIHDLRHTYASHLVSNGEALQKVQKLLGHTKISTTERYAHVADEAVRSATNRFGAIYRAAQA
jgi:integrase